MSEPSAICHGPGCREPIYPHQEEYDCPVCGAVLCPSCQICGRCALREIEGRQEIIAALKWPLLVWKGLLLSWESILMALKSRSR